MEARIPGEPILGRDSGEPFFLAARHSLLGAQTVSFPLSR